MFYSICIVALIFTIGSVMKMQMKTFDWGTGRLPVSIVNFNVPESSWPNFFDRLEVYARENNLDFGRSRIHPLDEQFGIILSRKDIAMSAVNVRSPLDFEFAFYVDPTNGGSQKTVDELEKSLSLALQSVAGLSVSKKK